MTATPIERLRRAKGFLLDMDGTLVLADAGYRGATPLPGAVAFIERLNREKIPFVVLTNGSARSPEDIAAMLCDADMEVGPKQVVNPVVVVARHLARRGVKTVMAISPEAGLKPFADEGLDVFSARDRRAVDAVFVGGSRDCAIKDIENAAHAVLGGARLLTASMNLAYMTAQGRAFSTSRPISAAITSLTGKRPVLSGKPSVMAFRAAAALLGAPAGEIAVVGDDAAMEVELARRGGALSVLLRTGISGAVATEALPERHRPDLHLASVEELLALCMR